MDDDDDDDLIQVFVFARLCASRQAKQLLLSSSSKVNSSQTSCLVVDMRLPCPALPCCISSILTSLSRAFTSDVRGAAGKTREREGAQRERFPRIPWDGHRVG